MHFLVNHGPKRATRGFWSCRPRPASCTSKPQRCIRTSKGLLTYDCASCLTQVSELGDKTFLTSAILAMRHSPVVVFWGSWSAMICMSIMSAMMGAVLPALLSHHMSLIIATVLFLGFGVAMLWHAFFMSGDEINREWEEADGEIRAEEEEHELGQLESDGALPTPVSSNPYPAKAPPRLEPGTTTAPRRSMAEFLREGTRNLCGLCFSPVYSQAFLLSFIGEWGDRSQITTVALAATHVRLG